MPLETLRKTTSTQMTSAAIREQVQYYFSDKNLRKDNFIKSLMDEDG